MLFFYLYSTFLQIKKSILSGYSMDIIILKVKFVYQIVKDRLMFFTSVENWSLVNLGVPKSYV